MKVYIDLLLVINFLLDFNIIYIVNKILKRNISIKKIILSSLIGEFSLIFLLIHISSVFLFIIKIVLCFIMCVITFRYKDIKYTINNMAYFYMISTIYSGILFFLKDTFNNKVVYVLLIVLLLPLFTYKILKYLLNLKSNYKYYYKVKINFNKNKSIVVNSFLDTGNKLKDPYTNKPIILIDSNKVSNIRIRSPIYVPFSSIKDSGLIECIKIDSIEIEGQVFKNYLLGMIASINIDGIDCLLNYKLLEELTCLEK